MTRSADDFQKIPLEELLHEASQIRQEHFGNEIEFCAIVNIKSGRCAMDCRFCAQSVHYATNIESYPLLETETLVSETQNQWSRGIHRIGWVSSGCSPTAKELDAIVESAMTILSQEGAGHLCCASLGQLETSALLQLKAAGFCRYHHNLETSERFYPSICTMQRWRDRRATVERVKELGWAVCSGGLFGLGESWQDRYDLAIVLREIGVDSIPINFLNPIPGTPLADSPILTIEEALRILAMFRILVPKASIRICGGRPAVFGDRQSEILRSGLNAMMTGDYLTTSGISPERDKQMIRQAGFC